MSVLHMWDAWDYLARRKVGPLAEGDIKVVAALVNGVGGLVRLEYRSTPVAFVSGGYAVSAQQVPRCMSQLMEYGKGLLPREWVYEFLRIHPFEDGNGRTASLIWNYMNGTIQDPAPLPRFDFT